MPFSRHNVSEKRLILTPAVAGALLLCSVLVVASCGTSRGSGGGGGQRYDLKGKVVSVDKAGRKVAVDHEAIPGFMEAMVMDFTLKDRDALEVVGPGDRIQATLVVADDGGAWLENPMITKAAPGGDEGAAAASVGPKEGEVVPNFALVNQDDKKISLAKYKGRALVLTFIYTRCPLADYCPLMSERFAALRGEMVEDPALKSRAHLLSVSIDPLHDTPKVLRSYGGAYTEKYGDETYEHWEFATGEPEEVRRLAQFFGMEYYGEKDQIIHSLRTAVIDPEGRVRKVYRGNEWQASEVLREVRESLNAAR